MLPYNPEISGILPLVSLIVPARNEGRHIERTLASLAVQDYPPTLLQVIVAEGRSTDNTREVADSLRGQFSDLRVIDNAQKTTPAAINCGLRAAAGEVVVLVGGHSELSPEYVRLCVDRLSLGVWADCVGGPIQTVGETWIARGIAVAQSSPFGVGSALFRYANRAQYVDTVAFGAYRREVFDRIGLFDEELVRNQDDEFNFRLIKAGGKIWLDPAIRSTYYSRSTLRALWKQYFDYGFWKVRVIQKHKRPASWRHLVPAAFVLVLGGSLIGGLLFGLPILFITVLFAYVGVSLLVSLALGARKGWQYVPVLPLAFATMHLAYGIGFLVGIFRFSLSRRPLRNATKNEWTT